MGDRINPINIELLNDLIKKTRPKVISTYIENGVPIKVYEPRQAANISIISYGVRGLHYD